MVDPQSRINRLRKMLVRRTSLTGPICGTQYCPVEKTPYVLITIFLLILHHYLKSTKTYLNKRNSGLRGTRGTGKYGNRRTRQQLIFIFSFCVANFHPGGKSIKSSASKYPALQNLDVMTPSSETQGQIVGARESLNKGKNMAQKKSKERPEEPLGTMSYQTSSKRSPPFWRLIDARKHLQ